MQFSATSLDSGQTVFITCMYPWLKIFKKDATRYENLAASYSLIFNCIICKSRDKHHDEHDEDLLNKIGARNMFVNPLKMVNDGGNGLWSNRMTILLQIETKFMTSYKIFFLSVLYLFLQNFWQNANC